MSAVSSGSPRASADLNKQLADRAPEQPPAEPNGSHGPHGPEGGPGGPARTDFGPNQWLVDELYQRYQADPSSVDRAWWNFFADYHPLPAEPRTAARPGGAAAGDRAGSGPPATGLA